MLTLKSMARMVIAGAFIMALLILSGGEATARPKYLAVANAKYPELVEKHGKDGKLTCVLCHPSTEKKKTFRNNFGAALGKSIGKKNETDEDKIKEALSQAEKEKSATEGKTFGDLIAAGELPGTDEAVK